MHSTPVRCLVVALGLLGLGCITPSDPLGRREALTEVQKRYTEAIRWGDLERASRYVHPDLRDRFLDLAGPFESVRFTDYEIGDLDLAEDSLEAEVVVSYRGYVLPQYSERRADDRQRWVRDSGLGHGWQVKPELTLLLDAMGVPRRR